jgi:hypothetical protein
MMERWREKNIINEGLSRIVKLIQRKILEFGMMKLKAQQKISSRFFLSKPENPMKNAQFSPLAERRKSFIKTKFSTN